MKTILTGVAAAALIATGATAAEKFELDRSHTQILFEVNHLGFSTNVGQFKDFDGVIYLDQEDPSASRVEATIQAASLDTAWEARDEHLRNDDFFDVENHPTITFTSTEVDVTGEKTAKVTGDLTLLGVTKPVTLDVTLNQMGPHPFNKKMTAGFSATAVIKRSEFGMTTYVPNLSDDVKLTIHTEAAEG